MDIKIKKLHPDAVIPKYARPGDAGLDLVAVTKYCEPVDSEYKTGQLKFVYGTGLALEIPENYAGFVFPRSSIHKKAMVLANSVGVIDSGYRAEIKLIFKDLPGKKVYDIGDRIGQLIILPYPQINFTEVKELSSSVRNEGGFGSTGE